MNRRNFLKLSATTGALLALPVLAKSNEHDTGSYYKLKTLSERIKLAVKAPLNTVDDLNAAMLMVLPRIRITRSKDADKYRGQEGFKEPAVYSVGIRDDTVDKKHFKKALRMQLQSYTSHVARLNPTYYVERGAFITRQLDNGDTVISGWWGLA